MDCDDSDNTDASLSGDCDSDGVSNCNGDDDTRMVLSDPLGEALNVEIGDCIALDFVIVDGCMDSDACNYGDYADCIYPEEFYDFSQVRPHIKLNSDGMRELKWPTNEIYFHQANPSNLIPIISRPLQQPVVYEYGGHCQENGHHCKLYCIGIFTGHPLFNQAQQK